MLFTVQGVIVRLGRAKNDQEYVVVWSPETNHSFIFKKDISPDEWFEALQCDWREYDVNVNTTKGPEGIETQAYNLRKPEDDSKNPSTVPSQAYTDVHSLRIVNVFVPHNKTIKFKDTFNITNQTYNTISGKFIKDARVSPSDISELRKFNISTVECIAVLEQVTKREEQWPWKITQYVYEAKELSLHGYCSKLGFLRHGRGGALCDRREAVVPPDTLRLKKPNKPSRFALGNTVAGPPPCPLQTLNTSSSLPPLPLIISEDLNKSFFFTPDSSASVTRSSQPCVSQNSSQSMNSSRDDKPRNWLATEITTAALPLSLSSLSLNISQDEKPNKFAPDSSPPDTHASQPAFPQKMEVSHQNKWRAPNYSPIICSSQPGASQNMDVPHQNKYQWFAPDSSAQVAHSSQITLKENLKWINCLLKNGWLQRAVTEGNVLHDYLIVTERLQQLLQQP